MADAKIVIIGAGASGIAAATRLLENGFENIIILEAENRIGGRINSVPLDGGFVDIGGQWVHGEKGNIVYEMVKDLDLVTPSSLPKDPGMSFFLSDGSMADKTITDRLFAIIMAVKDDKDTAGKFLGSFAQYITIEYKKRVLNEFGANARILELSEMVLKWFQKFMVLLNPAETWDQLSTTSHYVFQPCEGDQLLGWRKRGYRTIIDVMTKKIPDPSKQLPLEDKILLNKEVSQIIWDVDDETHDVLVKCTDGSAYPAHHVIVTVSVGVLKDIYATCFEPPLPEYKINSIEGVPLGTVNKILLKFPTKWWPDTMKDISFLWSEEDRNALLDEVSAGPIVNGKSWLENLFSFIAIDSHPNVLLGWVNGPTAKLVELLPDETVIESTMYMLRKFAGRLYHIPEPDVIVRSKWGSNPHFKGSYAYVNAQMEKTKASANDLAQPLMKNSRPVVQFAGEATHSTLFSTVNGAMETGYREAERIISLYK
ncbi:spermine oxidase-like [Rhynchophorus ferrugineus]|uniref:spermine oxidase-like n=1 Tax=Rhynchophorus ferrugineus TaxID=354439 RepID=UPI003FCEB942